VRERFVLAANFDLMDPSGKGLDQALRMACALAGYLNFGRNLSSD
jgi:hypothetical protein